MGLRDPSGAEKDELQKVFSSRRQTIAILNKLWLEEVTELGQTIRKFFRRDLEGGVTGAVG
jgi:hypothetical protein